MVQQDFPSLVKEHNILEIHCFCSQVKNGVAPTQLDLLDRTHLNHLSCDPVKWLDS
jgi:hypothetical protein